MIKAGVLGWPISHSKSPLIHGHWLQHHGIDGSYDKIAVEPDALGDELRRLMQEGYAGVNVTLPHKEEALEFSHHMSAAAREIGAANTLVFGEGRIFADNTDVAGFYENLRQSAPDWRANHGPALVLGAGGAARAILYALLKAGAPKIYLSNRTGARAEELAAAFGPQIEVIDWDEKTASLHEVTTLVNTTALGMNGENDLALDLTRMPRGALVTDIVYTPLETGLLRDAKSLGLQTVDGLGMLLHQAVPGFEYWFGKRPEVTPELRKVVLG